MRFLAEFVMIGRPQAVMVMTFSALLALLFPAFGIISSAALTLVTLRFGGRNGLIIMAMSGVACAVFFVLLFGTVVPVFGVLIALWLPVWLLGLLLRWGRSLSLAIEAALLFGVMLIAVMYLGAENNQQQSEQILQPLAAELTQSGVLDHKETQVLMHVLQVWLPGIVAAGFYLQLLFTLFIARIWQAQLYNPGGFVAEFQSMRIHTGVALLTLPLFVLVFMQGDMAPGIIRDLMLLLTPLWLIQGLAVIHGIISQANLHIGWLICVYTVLLLATIPGVILVALLGLTDSMVDFRKRLNPKP